MVPQVGRMEYIMIETSKTLRMHHSALSVSDLDKSLEFYCDGLGFEKVVEFPGFCEGHRIAMIRLPKGGLIELFSMGREGVPTDDDMYREWLAGNYFQYCIECEKPEDVDAMYEHVLTCGATSKLPPADYDVHYDGSAIFHACFVYGPDGEIIEFLCLPKEYGALALE